MFSFTDSTGKKYNAENITAEDTIDLMGAILALEGTDYEREEDALLNTKDSDICELIPYIKNSLITYLIALPKNVKNKE